MPQTETKRLFVAIFPPTHIVTSLQAAVAGLAKKIPARAVRWTRPEQVHLTLNFLGSVEVARIPEIESALCAACEGHQAHKVRVAGLGCFPNPIRPRILWAGLAGDLRPLENLKKSLDARLLAAGCVGEDRPFHPHLTIGRATDMNSAGRDSWRRLWREKRAATSGNGASGKLISCKACFPRKGRPTAR
jgi:2'-5' RNA ligase